MIETVGSRDVVLGPGDLWFGGPEVRVRTLLGSCVAVTLWHPALRIGGMCHYVVPSRLSRPGERYELSGHYADEAFALLLAHIRDAGTVPGDYQVKMFGGGNQFTGLAAQVDVAAKNVAAGLDLVERHSLSLASMHLGGSGHRQIVLELSTGDVWMRHVGLSAEEVAAR